MFIPPEPSENGITKKGASGDHAQRITFAPSISSGGSRIISPKVKRDLYPVRRGAVIFHGDVIVTLLDGGDVNESVLHEFI